MTPHGRPHRKRYPIAGHARYLTFSCFNNEPFFGRERTCRWFLQRLATLHDEGGFDLWAYVVMPTHSHLLLVPHDADAVGTILYRLKKSVTNRAVAWLKRNSPDFLVRMSDLQPGGKSCYRFWQRGGGYDRNIHSVQEAHEKIHYIHANPVRAGLVARPQDWLWSSWHAWHGDEVPLVLVDRETLPPLGS